MHHLSTALCVDWLSQQKSMVNRFLLENIKQNKEYKCYTLSHPETCWVFGDHAMGCRTSASPVICSIRHHDYSVYSSFPKSCSSSRFMFLNFALFHVSELRFVSCFRFTSHFCPPCSISVPQTPTLIYAWFLLPWHDSLQYLYVPNLMYVPQSEIDIDCPSNSSSKPPNPRLSLVWNSRTVDVWWRST